jgi:phage baseplate assembly protein gpV
MKLYCCIALLLLSIVSCDDDNSQTGCVQLGGNYFATFTTPSSQATDAAVMVQQQNCTVTANIVNYGQIRCTAQSNGMMPRLASCTETLESCTNQKDYTYTPTDDGTTFTFDVITRQSACTGEEGGTLVFRLQLRKQT